jgi:hypothetical protein
MCARLKFPEVLFCSIICGFNELSACLLNLLLWSPQLDPVVIGFKEQLLVNSPTIYGFFKRIKENKHFVLSRFPLVIFCVCFCLPYTTLCERTIAMANQIIPRVDYLCSVRIKNTDTCAHRKRPSETALQNSLHPHLSALLRIIPFLNVILDLSVSFQPAASRSLRPMLA